MGLSYLKQKAKLARAAQYAPVPVAESDVEVMASEVKVVVASAAPTVVQQDDHQTAAPKGRQKTPFRRRSRRSHSTH